MCCFAFGEAFSNWAGGTGGPMNRILSMAMSGALAAVFLGAIHRAACQAAEPVQGAPVEEGFKALLAPNGRYNIFQRDSERGSWVYVGQHDNANPNPEDVARMREENDEGYRQGKNARIIIPDDQDPAEVLAKLRAEGKEFDFPSGTLSEAGKEPRPYAPQSIVRLDNEGVFGEPRGGHMAKAACTAEGRERWGESICN